MRNGSLVLILCLGGALLGCSSKPDVSDVAAELNEFWMECPLVKLSNLKKTNGVDNGNTYRVAYSYTLEVLKDATEATDKECSRRNIRVLEILAHRSIERFKKGDVITDANEIDMVKSENGWVSQ